ncbi:CBO0543 family protein [Clostridium aceticum]|uniref:CBO0543 family protein n=1 Tax=Clostridium aceticum TaxID=84022 RepID=UPI00130DB571|nr:CBO0543 family protein [Clostridium aceticum]
MNGGNELTNKMIEAKRLYRDRSLSHWYTSEFGTWQWFLHLAVFIFLLYIWWKMIDKKRIYELLSYGFLVSTISIVLDVIGTELVLWTYPIRLLPTIPRLFSIDLTVMPVVYTIFYQKYPEWKQYIIVATIVALLYAFVAEPMLVWIGIYKLFHWRYIYSFPIYIAIAVFCKWIIMWLGRRSKV